jgi:peroxiredoxin
MLKPREEVPELTLKQINGESWFIAKAAEADFMTLLVFYRGYHCPVCKSYIPQLEKLWKQFEELGVKVVAASSDSKERAEKTYKEWGLDKLKLAYGLSIEDARKWGLYVSHAIKEEEPELYGVAKAYPIPIMNFHEIVNDDFAGQPVVLTYCPL